MSTNPEARFYLLLAQAYRAFTLADRRRLEIIDRILGSVNDEIRALLWMTAGPDGTISPQQMEYIRIRLSQIATRLEREYGAALEALIREAVSNANADKLRALREGYLFGAGSWPWFERLIGGWQMRLDYVSDAVVQAALTRSFHGLKLSDRIWRMSQGMRYIVEQEVLRGILANESAADIARRVERYLLPGRELPRGEVPSAPFSNQPRDVAYNAYRLARTEITQTYHDAHRRGDEELHRRGLVLGTRVVLSRDHARRILRSTNSRTARDICDDWAERIPGSQPVKYQPPVSKKAELKLLKQLQEYKIDPRGVYLPGGDPVEHPNGLCARVSVLIPREALLQKIGV